MKPQRFWVLLSAIFCLPAAQTSFAASNSPLAPMCYAVVDPKDQPTLDNAQEVVCVEASGHAFVRESSFFGEGVKGCNIVMVNGGSSGFTVNIDYRKCTNNSPSHQLVCDGKSTAGGFTCISKMGPSQRGRIDGETDPFATRLSRPR